MIFNIPILLGLCGFLLAAGAFFVFKNSYKKSAIVASIIAPWLMAATYTGLPIAPTNAIMKEYPSWQYFTVLRLGANTPGDSPALWYLPSSSSCPIAGGDGKTQIPSADGKCWLATPSYTYTGPNNSTPTNNFLVNLIPNTTNISVVSTLTNSNSGGFGIIGGAQMSQCTTSLPCDTFGIGGITIQDSALTNHTAFGIFGQTRAYPGSAGPAQANEFDIINVGPSAITPIGISPYGFYSGSGSELINTQLACGDPSVTNGNCSDALDILNNSGGNTNGFYLRGINFAANAILGTTGIDSDTTPVPAIDLGRMQSLSFWSLGAGNTNPTTPAGQIYGSTTAAGGTLSMNLNFASAGLIIEDAFSRTKNILFPVFNNATSYLQFTAGTALLPPNIQVKGTDVNIGLNLVVPGTGTFNFYDAGGSTNLFDIIGAGQVFFPAFNTPASSSATCVTGTTEVDANYVYVCTSTNTWKRAALSSF